MTPIPEATDERAAAGLALPRDVIDRLTIEALQELVYEIGGEALRYRVLATEQRMRAETMARRADIANDRLAERDTVPVKKCVYTMEMSDEFCAAMRPECCDAEPNPFNAMVEPFCRYCGGEIECEVSEVEPRD